MDEDCERLLRGRCCSARSGRSARNKLWARLLELRRSDLCREEQSWLVPQKIPSPRSVAWSVCAPSKVVNVVQQLQHKNYAPMNFHRFSGLACFSSPAHPPFRGMARSTMERTFDPRTQREKSTTKARNFKTESPSLSIRAAESMSSTSKSSVSSPTKSHLIDRSGSSPMERTHH